MPGKIDEELEKRRSERTAAQNAADKELIDRFMIAENRLAAIEPRLRILLHSSPRARAFTIKRNESVNWNEKRFDLHFDVYDPYGEDSYFYPQGRVCCVYPTEDFDKAIADATTKIVEYIDRKESNAARERKERDASRKNTLVGALWVMGVLTALALISSLLH